MNNEEHRKLQLFVSQAPFLYKNLTKSINNDIMKDFLLSAEESFIIKIIDKFEINLDEKGYF